LGTWITRVEQGESYQVCSACGQPLRDGRQTMNICAQPLNHAV
jgi:hypothetical protein